ncbi:MAG: 6-phosphogluconolactonase [Eudoraea sp.]|nr:6-phosphogluconolactonase [Eudoraea sp.]
MDIHIYDSKGLVARHFSDYLEEFIAGKNEVHIALSGGSTPQIVFEELASHKKETIDWSNVHFYWGDERCVPPTDDQSNYKMTLTYLLSQITIPATNIHRIKGEDIPTEEAVRYEELLREKLPYSGGIPSFDLVILGMGEDGHTASIFPHEIGLWESEKLCEVAVHPESGQKRITITGKVINHSKEVAFLVTGIGKKEKVAEIMKQQGDFKKYPASLVAPENGNLIWFLDKEAASGL